MDTIVQRPRNESRLQNSTFSPPRQLYEESFRNVIAAEKISNIR